MGGPETSLPPPPPAIELFKIICPYTQINTYPLYGDKRCPSEGVLYFMLKDFYDHGCFKEHILKYSCKRVGI